MKKMWLMGILAVFILSIAISIPNVAIAAKEDPFLYGFGGEPQTLDPHHAWDSASIDIDDQVCEGLFAYDFTTEDLGIIPMLATDMGSWSANLTEFTVSIRQGITFHDGSALNATAVKWSFDRLNHLISTDVSQLGELYKPLLALYPTTPFAINETLVMGDYTIKFVLNYPFTAFIPLLCYSGSYVLSPSSTPYDRLIEFNETLVGTGPYILESYSVDLQIFKAYPDYWRAQPEIQEMRWIFYNDDVAKQQAFLAGDIHMPDGIIPDYLSEYEANPNIVVHPARPTTNINYLGMNNEIINKTMRQVISYAINYDYIIHTIMNDLAVRMNSPVPLGIKFSDPTCQPATYDMRKARQILVDANLSKGLLANSPDLAWYSLTQSDPIAVYNYSYNIGNRVRGDLGVLIALNLNMVGIRIDLEGLSWPEFLNRMLGDFDKLELYLTGWGPDYNDPNNFINPLLSNTSLSNSAQVNDPGLQAAMMEGLTIADEDAREAKYHEMQHYIVEDLMPWAFLFVSVSRTCHNIALGNYPRNAMGKTYFYPCTWFSTTTSSSSSSATNLIPGYSLLVLLGVSALTVSVVFYKRRH